MENFLFFFLVQQKSTDGLRTAFFFILQNVAFFRIFDPDLVRDISLTKLENLTV